MTTSVYQSKLSPEMLKKAYDDLGETEERRNQVIQIIRTWQQQQPHLAACPIDEYTIVAFARGCKYSLEKMKLKLDLTFTLRLHLPEFFADWDPKRPEIAAALACGPFLPIPDYDHLGRRVIIMRMGCYDPSKHKAEDIEKANFMISDMMGSESEQMFVTGLVIISDLQGFTLNHLMTRPLSIAKKQMSVFQDSSPLSPKSINIVNTTPAFQSLFNFSMSIVNEKIKKRVKVHGINFENLHKEVNKDILPPEYGGTGLSLADLTAYWVKKAEDNRERLIAASKETRLLNEARRPGKPKTSQELFGIEGSFRKLEVD